jgi:hypothetical protein
MPMNFKMNGNTNKLKEISLADLEAKSPNACPKRLVKS